MKITTHSPSWRAPRIPLGIPGGLLFGSLLSLGLACSSAPPPETAPIAVPPTTAPPAPPPPRPLPPVVVEITPAKEQRKQPSLVEAAKAERERRQKTQEPVAVITNKNLKEYAKDGELTFVQEDGTEGETPAADAETEGAAEAAEAAQERFWRGRFLELRLTWQRTVEDLESYEKQAADLRRRFYAEDDPYVRDGQIKPEWDLVLERQARAREDLRRYPRDLQRLYQDAERAGAKPAWTQEGIEIQPNAPSGAGGDNDVEEGQLPEHQAVEPSILEEVHEP